MRLRPIARAACAIVINAALITVGVGVAGPATAETRDPRAVVIVSGGAAISPFTTPTRACATGYAAGSTDTFMRRYFLDKGYRVFTSPAMAGLGPVTEQPGDGGPFGDCPTSLPAVMTVDSTGDIDLAGVHLANFITYLHRTRGVDSVDIVAHSMGGLYSRSAIAYLKATNSPVRVNTLSTMGTPWDGAFFADGTDPANPASACDGFAVCEALLAVFAAQAPVILAETTSSNMTRLNSYYRGALKGIPVTLVAGNAFSKDGGDPQIWPNDGIVALTSALATAAPRNTITHRRCHLYQGGTHSIYISEEVGMADDTALTWNPTVGRWLHAPIKNPTKALRTPDGKGCPTT